MLVIFVSEEFDVRVPGITDQKVRKVIMNHLVVVFVFAQAAALQAVVELALPCVSFGKNVQFDLLQTAVQPSVAAPVLAGNTSDRFVCRFGNYVKTSVRGYYHKCPVLFMVIADGACKVTVTQWRSESDVENETYNQNRR